MIHQEVYKIFKGQLNNIKGYVQNVSTKAKDITNLIDLDKPFHGNYLEFNKYVKEQVSKLVENNNLNLKLIRKLQDKLRWMIDKAKKSGKSLNNYFKGCNK